MKLFNFLFIGLALAGAAVAQQSYTASQTTSLSAAAEVVTLQAPGSAGTIPAKLIHLNAAAISCSVACTVTLERDGTAASTTALTPQAVNREAPAAIALAYHASNVGVGTVVAQYPIAAGGTLTLDLADKFLWTAQENLTLRTNSITGTVYINVKWSEQ
jgi:hypothetical protein